MSKIRVSRPSQSRPLKAGDAVSRPLKVTRSSGMQHGSDPKKSGSSWTSKSAVRNSSKKK